MQGFLTIGETGFEPATARPPAGCATRLRHSPWSRPSLGQVPSDSDANICSYDGAAAGEWKCYRCGEFKAAGEFSWRRRASGQRDTFCRPCRSAYGKEHYAANRARYIEQARVQKQRLGLERTTYLIEYFGSHPCLDCGETDPVVLEFDHLRDKVFSIGQDLSRRNWQSILSEIEKCEVVCANCHRRRTAQRRGALRAVLTRLVDPGLREAGDRN